MSDELWIDIKSLRDIRLFLWMNSNDAAIYNYRHEDGFKKYTIDQIYGEDYKPAAGAINDAFRLLYKDSGLVRAYASNFKKAKNAMLPSKEFSWFKRCNDACYFAWVYIRTLSNRNKASTSLSLSEPFNVNTRTDYHRLIKILYPVNHRERIECIEDFFDRSSMDLSSKLLIMSQIRSEWDKCSPSVNKLPLKKTDKVKIKWAWDYICKNKVNVIFGAMKRTQEKITKGTDYHQENISPEYISNEDYKVGLQGYVHDPEFISLFRPSTTTEKFLSLRCIYIYMYCYDNKFLSRFKKAWESSTYRKAKKKKISGRKKLITALEGKGYINSNNTENNAVAVTSVMGNNHDKSSSQKIKVKTNESTPSTEINPGGDKEVKNSQEDNWSLFNY